MALIACPECAREVSDQAPACIHCGFPLQPRAPVDARPHQQRHKTKKFISLVVVILIIIPALLGLLYVLSSSSASTSSTSVIPIPTQTAVGRITNRPALATEFTTPDPRAAQWITNPRLIASNPDGYRGVNLKFKGEVASVEHQPSYTWIHVFASVLNDRNRYELVGTESIVVEQYPRDTGIIKGACYEFFGVGGGTTEVTRQLTGATNRLPLVRGYYIHDGFGCR